MPSSLPSSKNNNVCSRKLTELQTHQCTSSWNTCGITKSNISKLLSTQVICIRITSRREFAYHFENLLASQCHGINQESLLGDRCDISVSNNSWLLEIMREIPAVYGIRNDAWHVVTLATSLDTMVRTNITYIWYDGNSKYSC